VRLRHNVPLFGWIRLKGRCFDCGRPIPWTYPLVEAAFGAVGALVAARFAGVPALGFYLAFYWALLLAALVDWQTQYLYDIITLPLGAVGLAVSLVHPELLGGRWQSALACATVLGAMLLVQALGEWLFGREALGGGDVKLMAAAACFLGVPRTLQALMLASLFGLPLLLLYRLLNGGGLRDPAPFGPALALGCALAAWGLLSGGPVFPTWLLPGLA
jgi:leader peptidase (prepilin peptidase)/N-methyltransferase